ncbi:ATP-binding protein [Pseudorhodoplanes sinuspersici]|uniref:ATP-binding protein n=1 Tax=Pseudorhodoplanes sinuspersici TaxID=1235591 RepID=A0A1W6ZP82_9HYPH|nr:ATP-binding protein [Pseudorhodoplanes sinuspersici]ARP99203.1 ATP-binding protein [Pseudorhodoplanes sinuspersici]
MAWSSGKDSAWALHEIRKNGAYEIVGALTTVTDDFGRVSMHGVREDLLRAQLDAARLRSIVVRIPYPCPNDVYEQRMADVLAQAKSEGVTHVVFGDIFLADIRSYRETRLSAVGMTAVFPLWQRPTDQLARDMISAGVVAHLATIDLAKLPPSFAGRRFDSALLSELPPDVDPCGENGEFHSFVAAGPMFTHPIDVVTGETVVRDGFAYADLMRG